MSNGSIWPIDRILSRATSPGQSGLGGDSIPQVIELMGSHNQMKFSVIYRTFDIDAVDIFYSSSQQGYHR